MDLTSPEQARGPRRLADSRICRGDGVIDPSCEDPGAAPETLARADVTQLLRDYAQDALLLTPDGPITGRTRDRRVLPGAPSQRFPRLTSRCVPTCSPKTRSASLTCDLVGCSDREHRTRPRRGVRPRRARRTTGRALATACPSPGWLGTAPTPPSVRSAVSDPVPPPGRTRLGSTIVSVPVGRVAGVVMWTYAVLFRTPRARGVPPGSYRNRCDHRLTSPVRGAQSSTSAVGPCSPPGPKRTRERRTKRGRSTLGRS